MELKAFAVYNKVYDRVEGVYTAPTAGLAIRDNTPFLQRVSPHFLEDLELREFGNFSSDGLTFIPCEPVVHSWDEYKQPEIDISKKPQK